MVGRQCAASERDYNKNLEVSTGNILAASRKLAKHFPSSSVTLWKDGKLSAGGRVKFSSCCSQSHSVGVKVLGRSVRLDKDSVEN